MFSWEIKVEDDIDRVQVATAEAIPRILSAAGMMFTEDIRDSIHTADGPSPVGTPPHTRGRPGRNLPESIDFDVGEDDVVIGPRFNIIGEIGAANEIGEILRGIDYPERPFMEPALMRGIPMLDELFEGSIGD